MSKKGRTHPKGATGRPLEANESASTPVSATMAALAERELRVLAAEQAVANREETADRREAIADRRGEMVNRREKALRTGREAAKAENELGARTEADLREANERLVVATVHAQTMKEAADQDTAKMSYMAEHDFLTGLPNRALLTDRLAQSIALAQRHGKKVVLMYMDLDNFKDINDSLGHAVGDRLLQSVAKRLQSCVRISDTVSRQGGDEFVVLISEVEDVRAAVFIADKLIASMARPHLILDHRLHITLSIGISLYPDDGRNVEAVLRNADAAMYQAKGNGRNNWRVFTPEMNTHAVVRQSIEKTLHLALKQNGFVLHYQPKVNLSTSAVTGAEALLRLRQFDHQIVCPAQVVGVAEDCGLIIPIGRWVLREACRQTRAWLQAGLDLGQIAVNVSTREFHNKDFLAGVRDILDETGLPPRRLELELTESGLMQNAEQTATILHALKDLGVQIAIDDFGAGYSSLSYLRSFPINTLKIDQSFVQDIDGTAGEAIVSAIIAIGTSFEQRVVGVGIETEHQLAILKSHCCVEGQGYYFGRPVAAEEFATQMIPGRY